jgi:hypothetical protein
MAAQIHMVSAEQVRAELVSKTVGYISAIVADSARRIERFRLDKELLNGGLFYGNSYLNALKVLGQANRLEFFVKKGSFFHGYAPTKFFKMEEDLLSASGYASNRFVIKEGVSPSAAIEAMLTGPSFVGCGETCQLACLKALIDILGVEKFDMLYAADSSTPLTIQLNASGKWDSTQSLLNPKIMTETIRKGDIVYFRNISLYSHKHINGEGSGYMTICCDETPGRETFTALGLPPEGVSRKGVCHKLIEEFNAQPVGRDFVTKEAARKICSSYPPSELRESESLKDRQISETEFFMQGGGEIVGSFTLNAERIAQLANSSLRGARVLFDQWNTF